MCLKNNKLISNASWIIVCKIVQSIVALLIGTISSRYLGPSNYGLISYASSIVAFVVPISQLGLRNILVEQIVSHPEREGKIVGTSLAMSMFASLFCVVGCVGFVSIVNTGERDTLIVCALYSISLVFQMLEMIEYWYQAKLLSKYTSIIALFAYIAVALYKTFLLITQNSIYWFAVANALDYLMISVGLLIVYKKLGNQRLSFSFSVAKELFSVSKHYIVSGMMVTMFSQTDRIMIKMIVGNAENGYYSTAWTCAALSSFVFTAIIDTMRPLIYNSKKNNEEDYNKKVSLLFSIIIYMGLCQSVFITLFAKHIVLILYGRAYIASIPILQILTWYSIFSYMGMVRNIWILAEGKHKFLWIINLSGAVFNVIGNLILIPYLGAQGAAIATVATQAFTNFILCLVWKPIKPVSKLIWKSLNPNVILGMLSKGKIHE